jgi:hypothetical protein
MKYADLHLEYSLASMSLETGSALPDPFVDSRMLHHTSFGASTVVNDYLELPLKIAPRIAYFISGSAGIVEAFHSGVDPINIVPGKSKLDLYQPQKFLEGFERTSGFTFGIDAGIFEDQLSASLWMTFLSKKSGGDEKKGLELGLSALFSW